MNKLQRILVVDSSRVVRATLSKHLAGHFEILEEGSGESAWQTLMLDAHVKIVISGVLTPRLEAHDLLARLRASSIRRLQKIPFVLIVSDVENLAERGFDRSQGVTDFITKTMSKADIIQCLKNLLETETGTVATSGIQQDIAKETEDVPALLAQSEKDEEDAIAKSKPTTDPIQPQSNDAQETDVLTCTNILPTLHQELKAQKDVPLNAPPLEEPEKLLEYDKFQELLSSISFADVQKNNICALAFGIDNRAALISSFGEEIMKIIAKRIASLLRAKVGQFDSIGRCSDERIAIISHGVDLKQSVRFGKQVCKSLASGMITIRGQKVRLTASVGVASSVDDNITSGQELVSLAEKRLNQALLCGGNTVTSECKPGCPLLSQDNVTAKLIDALNAQGRKKISENIGTLGLNILSLIQVMDHELSLGLPLEDIQQKLQQRAKIESARDLAKNPS